MGASYNIIRSHRTLSKGDILTQIHYFFPPIENIVPHYNTTKYPINVFIHYSAYNEVSETMKHEFLVRIQNLLFLQIGRMQSC